MNEAACKCYCFHICNIIFTNATSKTIIRITIKRMLVRHDTIAVYDQPVAHCHRNKFRIAFENIGNRLDPISTRDECLGHASAHTHIVPILKSVFGEHTYDIATKRSRD